MRLAEKGQSYGEILRWGARELRASPTAMLDARVLLAAAAELTASDLIAADREPAPQMVAAAFREWISRRQNEEPIAYILGHQEFYGRPFRVTTGVLIPRPETEMIIDRVAATGPYRRGADIGTGSGCLAVTLVAERSVEAMVATDLSADALAVAAENATAHGATSAIRFIRGDLGAMFAPGQFDLIVSNPPYIEVGAKLPAAVAAYEPPMALFAGPEGLDAYRQLIPQIHEALVLAGLALLEIGSAQGPATLEMAQRLCPGRAARLHQDLSGQDRLLEIGPAAPK